MKKSFLLYTDLYPAIEGLCEKDKADLFDAIFCYNLGKPIKDLSALGALAFNFIKTGLERDREKYEKIVERNRSNGKRGGRPIGSKKNNPENNSGENKITQKPKKPNGLFNKDSQLGQKSNTQITQKPKKADNDNDNDNDNDIKETNKEKISDLQKEVLAYWVSVVGGNYKGSRDMENNIQYWINDDKFTFEEIKQAIANVPLMAAAEAVGKTFWHDMSPKLFFRQRNKNGEADYIEQALNYKKVTPNRMRFNPNLNGIPSNYSSQKKETTV